MDRSQPGGTRISQLTKQENLEKIKRKEDNSPPPTLLDDEADGAKIGILLKGGRCRVRSSLINLKIKFHLHSLWLSEH